MKLMFASDIHGSKPCCEKLLIRYMEEGPEKLVLLGDILYHGPRNPLPEGYNPEKVSGLLNLVKDNAICVRGNCDSEVDQMMLEFPILAEYASVFVDGGVMYLTHGHKYNNDNPLPMRPHDILIYGHTHVPMVEETDNGIFINTGSVSIPKDDSKNCYMIYEDGEFIWKDLDGKEFKRWSV